MMYFLQEFNIIFIIITESSWQITRVTNLKISEDIYDFGCSIMIITLLLFKFLLSLLEPVSYIIMLRFIL
jgi:hypothetical protein